MEQIRLKIPESGWRPGSAPEGSDTSVETGHRSNISQNVDDFSSYRQNSYTIAPLTRVGKKNPFKNSRICIAIAITPPKSNRL